MNKNFGKLKDGDLEYAKDYVILGRHRIFNPKVGMRYSVGERDVVEDRPEEKPGFRLVVDSYEQEEDRYEHHVEPAPEEGGEPAEWDELVYRGKIVIHYRLEEIPAPIHTVDEYDAVMEEHLRRTREERGYTTREPDAYINSSVQRWKQDAIDWCAFKDRVMLFALDVMNGYRSTGTAPMTLDEFRAKLPTIEWTEE